MNERIDHAERAREHIERGKNPNTSKPLSEAMLAQAEATLALMEQQRIANIFTLQSGAVNATTREHEDTVFDRDNDGDPVVKPEIAAALGIEEVRDA